MIVICYFCVWCDVCVCGVCVCVCVCEMGRVCCSR